MVITNKTELKEYLAADLQAQPTSRNFIKRFFFDDVVRLKKHLRYAEYHFNARGVFHKLLYGYHMLWLHHLCRVFNSEIPINVFGKGLKIWHAERIIVNGNARVGEYCSISSGVVIAQAHNEYPVIGDYVELMIDSKVLGGISVADHCRIGANTLVLKPIKEPNTTWAGVPARKITDRGTRETPAFVYPKGDVV